jgi:hypothetical protein
MAKVSQTKGSRGTPFLSARERDIALAQERLGDVNGRCRWLLDVFTATDPQAIATSERAVWRDNLLAIAIGPLPGGLRRLVTFREKEPLNEDIPDLWQKIVKLTGAHRGGSVDLPPLRGWLGRLDGEASDKYVHLGRGYGVGSQDVSGFEAHLLHAVADLLIACDRLKECPECKRLFVARRRQERHPLCARRRLDRNRPSRRKGA